ncbi:MAG: type II toxin-antitoxin system VapC family toxin [Actinomycetota bacterium]|nr:type II toxin-antitoxin system VapC family toxin [Actinomycetota bacterium]
MIVDTSALVAILRAEDDADRFIGALAGAGRPRISAATLVETAVVVDAVGDPVLSRRLDELVEAAELRVEPLTEQQAAIARQAYRDFGRGSGHPARLNLGDCFSYALASASGAPLLFRGNDFAHTGLASALTEE